MVGSAVGAGAGAAVVGAAAVVSGGTVVSEVATNTSASVVAVTSSGSSVVAGSSSGSGGAVVVVVGASVEVVSSTDATVVVGESSAVVESPSSPKSGSGALSTSAGKGGSVSPGSTATSDPIPPVQLAATTESIAAIATISKGILRLATSHIIDGILLFVKRERAKSEICCKASLIDNNQNLRR